MAKTKTSGKKKKYGGGYHRDDDENKLLFDLIPLEMLERLAGLYTRGAKLYGRDNWRLATGDEAMQRFRDSAWRHFVQYMKGDDDEDHASAIMWNIIALEYHKNK